LRELLEELFLSFSEEYRVGRWLWQSSSYFEGFEMILMLCAELRRIPLWVFSSQN
jgi:hypothetical protein